MLQLTQYGRIRCQKNKLLGSYLFSYWLATLTTCREGLDIFTYVTCILAFSFSTFSNFDPAYSCYYSVTNKILKNKNPFNKLLCTQYCNISYRCPCIVMCIVWTVSCQYTTLMINITWPQLKLYLSRFFVSRFLSIPSIKFSKHKCMACCFSGGWLLTMLFLRSAKYCSRLKMH